MKRSSLLLVLFSFVAPLVFADSQVVLPLAGLAIKRGAEQKIEGSMALDLSREYAYEITGTCRGTGDLSEAVPAGTSLADVVYELEPGSDVWLLSEGFNPGNKFPATVARRTFRGTLPLNGGGKAQVKFTLEIAIGEDGRPAFSVRNVSLLRNQSKVQGSIRFEDGGECLVKTVEPSSNVARPDVIMLKNRFSGIGNNIYDEESNGQFLNRYIKAGETTVFLCLIQNDSQVADSILITGDGTDGKVVISYQHRNEKITGQVTGEGYQLNLQPGEAEIIEMSITLPASTTSGSGYGARIYAESAINGAIDAGTAVPRVK